MFKVGDRVRLTGNASGSRNEIGDVGVVTEVAAGDRHCKVDAGRGVLGNWSAWSDLELVKPNRFIVDQIYTDVAGRSWKCLYVHEDGSASLMMAGVTGVSFVWSADGSPVSLGLGKGYTIKFPPVIEERVGAFAFKGRWISVKFSTKDGEIDTSTIRSA